MSRSVWKGPFVELSVIKKIKSNRPNFKTRSRSCVILPQFIGKFIEIHNGIRFIRIEITEDMVGHKLGEFSPTRSRPKHKVKKNK